MAEPSTKSVQLQRCIERLRAGDEKAREELLDLACERLTQLTRKMLRRFPRVKRWEDTDDVLQNVIMRLHRTLSDITPDSLRGFLRLAALNIRRELLDMVKHYYGPRGHGAQHGSVGNASDSGQRNLVAEGGADLTHEPERLAAWSEFHRQVGNLADDQREVFDLLWYEGLSQAEAAQILEVTERTIQRRWQAARLALFDAMHGELPPED